MAVSGISGRATGYVASPQTSTSKPSAQGSPQVSASASTSTPAATVEFSSQAIAAAAAHVETTARASGPPVAVAPKANNVKIALKESNEPLQLLTKQAKHGDAVAKLLLKQIEKKQSAAQSQAPGAASASAGAEEDSETQGPAEEHGSVSEKGATAEGSEAGESNGPRTTAESGDSGSADQHA